MFFRQITDPSLAQNAYLIGCQKTSEAIIIDPQRDVTRYHQIAQVNGLNIVAAADTHIHADYLTGAREYADNNHVTLYLSKEGGENWQYEWARNLSNICHLKDGQVFHIGKIRFEVQHTPGHTPEHLSYLVTDLGGGAKTPIGICTGDHLFVSDVGRPDLLESAAGMTGSRIPAAKSLYQSLQYIKNLSNEIQIWPAHGAGSACGKDLGAIPISTIGYEKKYNQTLRMALHSSEQEFIDHILINQPDPPLYWAEMKRLNRSGAPILEKIPTPQKVSANMIFDHLQSDSAVIIDTITDRSSFLEQHLRRSIYAPLGAQFSTVVGSFVELHQEVFLIIEDESALESTVIELARIGYDQIRGYALRNHIFSHEDSKPHQETLSHIRFEEFNLQMISDRKNLLLDTRSSAEYEKSKIPGSHHIPYTRLAAHLKELPEKNTIFVHCGSGMRATLATAFLLHKGYQAIAIDDHFTSWSDSKPRTN